MMLTSTEYEAPSQAVADAFMSFAELRDERESGDEQDEGS